MKTARSLWLCGFALLLASSMPSDWGDSAQYRRLPDPQGAEDAAVGSYLLSAIDSFYAWELRRPSSFEELCASPYARALPCADLKNAFTGQPLKVGKEPGDLVWTDNAGGFVAGTVDRADRPWKRKDWDGMFKNIRDRREQS